MDEKNTLINKKKQQKKDVLCGSILFQKSVLEKEIDNLKVHLAKNKSLKRKGNEKDVSAKRALLKKVSRVKRFLKILKRKSDK